MDRLNVKNSIQNEIKRHEDWVVHLKEIEKHLEPIHYVINDCNELDLTKVHLWEEKSGVYQIENIKYDDKTIKLTLSYQDTKKGKYFAQSIYVKRVDYKRSHRESWVKFKTVRDSSELIQAIKEAYDPQIDMKNWLESAELLDLDGNPIKITPSFGERSITIKIFDGLKYAFDNGFEYTTGSNKVPTSVFPYSKFAISSICPFVTMENGRFYSDVSSNDDPMMRFVPVHGETAELNGECLVTDGKVAYYFRSKRMHAECPKYNFAFQIEPAFEKRAKNSFKKLMKGK